MPKYTQEQLYKMAGPASDTEEEKMERARKAVADALSDYEFPISSRNYRVFPQGSYANDTNVRNNSDVDINVCYNASFYFEAPKDKTAEQLGIALNTDSYSYTDFREDVRKALVKHFGSGNVVPKNKCLHVKENTCRTMIDVVPTWEHRDYRWDAPDYRKGVALWTNDTDDKIINYPEQHIENGKAKNRVTSKRFKRLSRILKNLRYKMEDDNCYKNPRVTSFLLECLAYNLPNEYYYVNEDCNWNKILKDAIIYFYHSTNEGDQRYTKWTEVSGLLWLMYGHKWSREDVHEFMLKLWNFLEYES